MKRYCLALDLKNDDHLIEEYKDWHRKGKIWPEILASLTEAGIVQSEIYLVGNRLFMVLEVQPHFSWTHKNQLDQHNKKVQEWEELMWHFQQALPGTKDGEKWILMEKIFDLRDCLTHLESQANQIDNN